MDKHDPQAEQFDAQVAEAMHDVPVPADLADRLRATLRAEAPAGSDAQSVAAQSFVAPRCGASRRVWVIGGIAGALASAATLLVALWFWPQEPALVGVEDVMQQARAWHHAAAQAEGSWEMDAAPPAEYPLGSFVYGQNRAGPNLPWRRLTTRFYGRRGVAYWLSGVQKVRATLLVIDRRGAVTAPQLAALPGSPLRNALTTDGCTTATWIEGAHLYVLVVDGGLAELRALVREPGSMA